MHVMPVRHHLCGHRLLRMPALIELGKRLEQVGAVRATNDATRPETRFDQAPETNRAPYSVCQSLEDVQHAHAWMALHSIQRDPEYRALLDEVLDDVQPRVERKDPGMRHRAGFVFVASPNAVTPYHLDHNHNFLLQIEGRKTVYVWDPLERAVTGEVALELFHGQMSRKLVAFSDELLQLAHKFELEPGVGAYIPTTAPHLVINGDNPSVTVSVCYHSSVAWRHETLYRANFALRRLGISPSAVGSSAPRDALVHLAFLTYLSVKAKIRKVRGLPVFNRNLKYAPVPSYYY